MATGAHSTIAAGATRGRVRARMRNALFAALVAATLTINAQASLAILTDAETVPASFATAAAFSAPISFVKVVGSSSCGGPGSVVTVPAAGVAAGHTLVLSVVIRGNSSGAVAASDTRGNTYTVDATSVRPGQGRTLILSAYVGTALQSGDSITVTHPNDNAEGAVVAEFAGIAASGRVDVTATTNGNSATPSATVVTTGGRRLVVGAVGNPTLGTVTEAGGWSTIQHLAQNCGTGSAQADQHSAYRIEATSGSFAYGPTLASSQHWYEAVVAYK